MSGFSRRQLAKLCQEVDDSFVQKRRVAEKTLSYLPGWFVMSEANAIFGYGGWDRQTLDLERLFERTRMDVISCGYLAKVRVTVRAGNQDIVRDGTGVGYGNNANMAEAHETAIKGAETDATKRALATFGSRFGLSLYRPRTEASSFALLGPNGGPVTHPLSPQAFAGGLRQMIWLCRTDLELSQLLEANRDSIEALRAFSALRATSGRHYADILFSLAEKRRQSLSPAAQSREPDMGAQHAHQVQRQAQAGPVVPTGSSGGTAHPSNTPTQAAPAPGTGLSVVPVMSNMEARAPTAPCAARTQASNAGGTETALLTSIPAEHAPVSVGRVTHLPITLLSQASEGTSDKQSPELAEQATTQAIDLGKDLSEGGPMPGAVNVAVTRSEAQVRPISLSSPARTRPGWQIDKSVLNYSSERRIRNKEHLQYVASEPCLVCEQLPCHAHHIAFAQPRGLSLKVSDEFTVPLCALHHNALHQHPPEKAWWANIDINPLQAAAHFWQQTLQRLIKRAEQKPATSAP